MMRTISHWLLLEQTALLEPYGITGSQAKVLMFLIMNQERRFTHKEVEEALALRGPTITSTLKYLEKGGFIERSAHENDGRSKVIEITPKGHELRGVVEDNVERQREELLRGFSPNEREQVTSFLQRMLENLEEKHRRGCKGHHPMHRHCHYNHNKRTTE